MPIKSELEKIKAELEHVNKTFEEFAYIVSHDLKAPARGITNFANFLIEDYQDKLDAEGKEKLNTLIRLSERLTALLDALLLYSRASRLVLVLLQNNIDDIIKEQINALHLFLTSHHAEVRIANKMPTIICDATAMSTIFKNLISNAVKFNRSEKKIIEINYHENEAFHQFSVKDNGIGILKKHYEQIFKIFRKLNRDDEYEGGTGAGLTIAQIFIKRHHGQFWLESVVGEGTTFYFTISKTLQTVMK